VVDWGTWSRRPVDYPDCVRPAALSVSSGETRWGIVFGGSGNGEAITSNKVKGIRCAVCWNEESARLAKEHNDANMIALGARMMNTAEAFNIVDTWLHSRFRRGRHQRRIEKIEQRTIESKKRRMI
jgi:ribose 5-phosphate isomerase B